MEGRSLCFRLIVFCWMSSMAEAFVDAERKCDSLSATSHIIGAQQSFCFSSRETNRRQLVCFGDIDDDLEVRDRKVRTLVLCGWRNETFDPAAVLGRFPLIRKLIIANSKNISRLTSSFPKDNQFLEKVAVTRTGLANIPRTAFSALPSLKLLDLRNNSLGHLDAEALNATSLRRLYLAGNPLRCTEAISWILSERADLAGKIVDREKLRCSSPYEGRPLLPIIRLITTLREECARTVCECELIYTLPVRSGSGENNALMAFNSVNCSARGLREMPTFLPANTTTLRLNGNKIRDLSPLVTNPTYERVLDLYLDDNEIHSILELEGSYWLDHFRLFSLRGNRLTDLPTYALENALLRSDTAATLNLGNNPWTCDCLFTPGFQDLLVRYASLVKDIDDVRCGYVSNDENSGKQIRDLTRTEICAASSDDHPWIHPLDILNILLASLIFLVLGKLCYDYWSFKRTGKLPWIVTKIP